MPRPISWFTLVVVVLTLPLPTWAAPRPAGSRLPLGSDGDFVEPLEKFRPKVERTEEEVDRLTASTLFAYGRVLYQRKQFDLALRKYQRAWRFHPGSVSIMTDIVPLAASLDRIPEAARYAAIAAETTPVDSRLLMGLAAALSEQGDWARAIRLYERALAVEAKGQPGVGSVLMWLEIGRLYFLTEEYEKSADAFAKAREAIEDSDKLVLPDEVRKRLVGDAERTYSVMAESFLLAKRWEKATSAIEKAYSTDEQRPLRALQLARVSKERGEPQAAIDQLDAYFASKSTEAGEEPYAILAEAIKQSSDSDEQAQQRLLDRLKELHAAHPEASSLGYFLAGKLLDAEQLDEAQQLLDELQNAEPTARGFGLLIELHERRKDFDALLLALGKAVALTGDLDTVESQLEAMLEDKERTGALLERSEQAIAGDEPVPVGVPLVAAYLALLADKPELLDRFTAAALKADEPAPGDAAVALGLAMLRQQQFERSAAIFQQVIDDELKPDRVGILHFYRSGALALAKQTDAALEAARAAAAANPKLPAFEQRIGWVLYHARRLEEAEKAYVTLVEKLNGNHDPDVRATLREARLVLSNICVQQHRMQDAEEWLEQVLDEYPEDIGVLNDLGYLWVDQGKNLRRALGMVQKAVAAEPDNKAYRDSLGWAFYRLGRYEEAARELELAADAEEPDGVILDHLGDVYEKLGQHEKAESRWRQAIESFQANDETRQVEATRKKLSRDE
jgi:tetratricopeptide (TPR) repeat protein